MTGPETKLSKLEAAAARGDWPGALRIAAKFADLGEQRAEITRAHECITRPDFYRQLGRDPDVCLEAGIAALKERYDLEA